MEEKLIGQVFPGWQILRRVARDSRTATYEIFRQGLGGSEKAILSITTAKNEQAAAKVFSACKALEGLGDAPGIVRCKQTEYTQSEGIWYIFSRQELVTPLAERMDAIQIPEQIQQMAKDLAAGLALCHARGILHMDIRPEQIFLTADGKFKLANPGVRWAAENSRIDHTVTDECLFLAPEAHAGACSTSSDTYSLGLVLYWALNDKCIPFLGSNGLEAERARATARRLEGELVPPPRNGSEDLKDLVMQACAFAPERRFNTAAQMRKALDELDRPQAAPVFTPPPAASETNSTSAAAGNSARPPRKEPRTKKEPVPRQQGERKRNPRVLAMILGAAALVVLLLVLLPLLRSCGTGDTPQPSGTQTTPTTEPVNLGWSDWAESLPADVTTDSYVVQEQPLYRTRVLEHNSSTTDTAMAGWTFVETVDERGDFQEWSDWSLDQPQEDPDREIETETRYRSKTRETKTSSSDTMNGWTHYDTSRKKGEYGSWSSWGTEKISATENRDVDTKTQYRSRKKSYTTSEKSSLDGWTQYDSKDSYGAWGEWSGWSEKKTNGSDIVEVRTREIEVPGKTEYIYGAYFSDNSPKAAKNFGQPCPTCAEKDYGGTWTYKTYSSSSPVKATSTSKNCSHVGSFSKRYHIGSSYYYYEKMNISSPVKKTEYSYRTRSKTTTYSYYQWGPWSDWSDTKPASDLDIQERTLYRSRTCETYYTYHFYRWTDWTDWSTEQVKANDNRKVESQTYYRYRDREIIPTHYFSRWSDWSDFSTEHAAPSAEQQVDARLQLRWKVRTQEDVQEPWRFTDIPENSAHYEAVKWMVDHGITSGTSETTFTPTGPFTRRQMAIMFWRAMGYPEPHNMQMSLNDVTSSDPYRKAIIWVLENGLTTPEAEGIFGPDSLCTRGQFITALYRAMGSPSVTLAQEPFEDVETGMIAYDAVLWSYANNISSGIDNNLFGVDANCERAQAATMFYRAMAEQEPDVPETTAPEA